jgi:hypothetical protein
MYDVMISEYDGANDLMIEVKSSVEVPHIRMAIGQLLDYRWRRERRTKRDAHLAIMLPAKPCEQIRNLLKSLDIQLMWLEKNYICSENSNLSQFLRENQN